MSRTSAVTGCIRGTAGDTSRKKFGGVSASSRRLSPPRDRPPEEPIDDPSSCCSARTAPTRRRTAGRLGKMPTTLRRRISLLRRPELLPVGEWEAGEGQDVGSRFVQERRPVMGVSSWWRVEKVARAALCPSEQWPPSGGSPSPAGSADDLRGVPDVPITTSSTPLRHRLP